MNHSRASSFDSFNTNSSSKSGRSIWRRLNKIFHPKNNSHSSRQSSIHSGRISGAYSSSSLSSSTSENQSQKQRHLKQLIQSNNDCPPPQQMMLPPFSPTYCKTNEFPYSNFYVKLPDGRWMVRYRDGNRDILRTDIIEGYMI